MHTPHNMRLMALLCLFALNAQAQQQPIGQVEERRALEREAEQQRRLQPRPDVRLEDPAAPSPAPTPLPPDETPCFLIQRVNLSSLSGDATPAFAWLHDALAGPDSLDPPVGRCLGTRGIAQLIDRTQEALVARGFVTTRVFAPPQDLSGGDLTLHVLPGRIRSIRFAEPISERAAALNALPMGPGDLLNLRDIEQALENFKRVPTVEANIDIVPADGPQDAPGLSDLVITWRQDQLFRVSLGLDDGGSRSTGKYLSGLTVSYDHALTLNDLFYLTLQRDLGGGDAQWRGTRGASAHYSVPLGYWLLGFNAGRQRYYQTVPGPWQDSVYSGWSRHQDIRISRLVHRDALSKTTLSFKAFARQSNNVVEDLELPGQQRRVGGWELGVGHRAYVGDAVLDLNLAYKRGTGAFGSRPAVEEAFGEGTSRFQLTSLDAGLQLPFDLGGRPWRYSGNLRAQFHHTPLTPQDRFATSTKIDSNYESVNEQSGIRAGDGGFQIQVDGVTELIGGAITSTQAAVEGGANSLTTGTLISKGVQNTSHATVESSGVSMSSDMLSQGKYGASKAVIGNSLNNANESERSSGQTWATVSGANITITDESAQQAMTGLSAEEAVASLNRDANVAHTAAERQDVQAMKQSVEAERALKQELFKAVTALTDEAYRSRMQQVPTLLKVECPAGQDCSKNPELLIRTPVTKEEIAGAEPKSIIAVNGILNDQKRGAELAFQNTLPDAETGEKPKVLYLMHIEPARNSISELLGVAYEKIITSADYGLANFLGYTNAHLLYADLIESRGGAGTASLGHSRGTLIQEGAFTILANRSDSAGNTYTNPNLSVRGVGGAANAEDYSSKAAKILSDPDKLDRITYNYFSNDPVATSNLAGGNPGMWTLNDLWQVFETNNSMHSCYGTGAKGCTQVEMPMPGGPQGTPEGNAKLIQYVGGKRVDSSNLPLNDKAAK